MNDILHAGRHFLTYNVSRHKHNNWELVYCTEKCGAFIFDDIQLPYSAGDIVVIPPNTPHKNVSENGFTNIHLNIGSSTLAFRQPVLIKDDANQTLLHLFSDAYYLFCSDMAHKAELLSSYGTLIARFLLASQSCSQKNRIAEQIEQSIVHGYADPNYKLDEVLAAMPYCADYLCRVFRREMGLTPHKYLTDLRLRSAVSLLHSDYSASSITEIARLCGFRNPLYFSRLFKQKYGLAPREYAIQQAQEPECVSQKIILPE